jgi:uncharacterized membrane protein
MRAAGFPSRLRATADAVLAALQCVLLVAFPLLVLAGVSRLGARATAVLLGALLLPGLVRAALRGRAHVGPALALPLFMGALLALAALLDDGRFMLAYPVLVNGGLLVQFAVSLRAERPIVEVFARLQVRDLSPAEQGYCRAVTVAWCVFFLVNGGAAALLAAFAPRGWWAAYTGGISYALVGMLFAIEYVVRKARFGRFGRGPVDRLLALLLQRSTTG